MTTLENILIIILYTIGGIVTGIKIFDMLMRGNTTPVCILIMMFWPLSWIVRFIQAFFVDDWGW